MKVVVDTIVIIAGLVADGICRDILKRRLLACELFASQRLLNELAEKMREKFGLNPAEAATVEYLRRHGELIKPKPLPKPICRDSDDDEVLATALATGAEVIFTGDKDLLVLKEFQGIKILSPRQFVEQMDRRK